MTDSLRKFEHACYAAGRVFNLPNAALNRRFGLADFLADGTNSDDGPLEIAVAAAGYFCEGHGVTEDVFRFGVYAVALYLHTHRGRTAAGFPTQAASDLVQLLKAGYAPEQVADWVRSNFSV